MPYRIQAIFAQRTEKVKVRVVAPVILYPGINLMCARGYLLCTYLHDGFGSGIGATKWDTSAPLRPGYGGVHKVDFRHTVTAVVPDSPQGTRWASRARRQGIVGVC